MIFLEYFFHGFEVEWLGIDLIHSGLETTHFIVVVHMSSDADDFGLLGSAVAFLVQDLPNFLGGLDSVHLGHVKICEYNLVFDTNFEGFF